MNHPTLHIEHTPVVVLVQRRPSGRWKATCELSAFEFEKPPGATFFAAYGPSRQLALDDLSRLFTRDTRLHWIDLTGLANRHARGAR